MYWFGFESNFSVEILLERRSKAGSAGHIWGSQWAGSFDSWRKIFASFDGWRLKFRAFDRWVEI